MKSDAVSQVQSSLHLTVRWQAATGLESAQSPSDEISTAAMFKVLSNVLIGPSGLWLQSTSHNQPGTMLQPPLPPLATARCAVL